MSENNTLRKKIKRTNGSERPLLRDVAYERLKDAIRDGELRPGEALSETRLSEALQISRTPIREALQQLAQEGLVQNLPNRAMTVAAPSMQEVLNVLHVRSLLDPEISRLVANSASPEVIAVLQEAVDQMNDAAESGDRSAWSRADTIYHEMLTKSCPNSLLGQLALQMRNRIHYLATDSQTTPVRLIECTEEHQLVVNAISEQDPAAAREAMEKHIEQLRTSFFKRLAHT